jgi:hypothetical protein
VSPGSGTGKTVLHKVDNGDNISVTAQEIPMPFDCTPIIDTSDRSTVVDGDFRSLRTVSWTAATVRTRPMPGWHVSRRLGCTAETLAVLVRARALLSDERRWCKGSFARSWLDIPVPSRSVFAQRYCALGAIMQAGRELGLPTKEACKALEWQTVIPVADWNDNRLRTHAEVIAVFDAATAQLGQATVKKGHSRRPTATCSGGDSVRSRPPER